MKAAFSVKRHMPRCSLRSWRKETKKVDPVLCGAKRAIAVGLDCPCTLVFSRPAEEGRESGRWTDGARESEPPYSRRRRERPAAAASDPTLRGVI
eukprot:scaffold43175_cov33-Tisochrysis_lutea.AAC.2